MVKSPERKHDVSLIRAERVIMKKSKETLMNDCYLYGYFKRIYDYYIEYRDYDNSDDFFNKIVHKINIQLDNLISQVKGLSDNSGMLDKAIFDQLADCHLKLERVSRIFNADKHNPYVVRLLTDSIYILIAVFKFSKAERGLLNSLADKYRTLYHNIINNQE